MLLCPSFLPWWEQRLIYSNERLFVINKQIEKVKLVLGSKIVELDSVLSERSKLHQTFLKISGRLFLNIFCNLTLGQTGPNSPSHSHLILDPSLHDLLADLLDHRVCLAAPCQLQLQLQAVNLATQITDSLCVVCLQCLQVGDRLPLLILI